MRPNRLRQLLNEGKPTIGTHVIDPWPGMIEIIGHSGVFDYIEYVGEYSSFDLLSLDNTGRALDLFPNMSSMMKVEEQNRGFIAQRSLGAGIQNLLFTDIRTADDARACVALVRSEASGGIHGASMRRNVGYVLESGRAPWVKGMEEVVIAVMIEKKVAMDNLEEILQVEGVDMLQFGPSDYSVSIGKPGAGQTPEVQDQQKRMIEMALKAGKHPRVEIGSLSLARPWMELGVKHFCVGWDIRVIYEWCQAQGKLMEELGFKSTVASPEAGYGGPAK